MAKVVARSYFDVVGLDQGGVACPEDTLAVQASKEETDINNIVNQYLRTGTRPEAFQGVYADVSEIGDLREAIEMVRSAEEVFMALPATVRRRFDNDPAKLVEFAQDASNLEEAVKLGLARPRQPEPVSAPVQGAGAGTEPARPAPASAKADA